MKSERHEELVVRWLDDELSAEERHEMEQLLAESPELHEFQAGFGKVRAGLRETYAPPKDIPYGDFFQTRLQRAIASAEEPAVEKARGGGSWREMFRWWLAPVAAGSLALAFLAGTRVTPRPVSGSGPVVQAEPLLYTPEGGVTAQYKFTGDGGADVIYIEGLQALPDSIDLMAGAKSGHETGQHLVSHERTVF